MRVLKVRNQRVIVGLAALVFLYVVPIHAQLTLPKSGEALPSFEVATIKPSPADARMMRWGSTLDGYRIDNFSLSRIIMAAYGATSDAQLVGGPQALMDQHFDVLAKMDPENTAKYKAMSRKDKERYMNLMLQALLRDRFHLKIHVEVRELPVYGLVVAKGGPKLKPSAGTTAAPAAEPEAAAQPPDPSKPLPHRVPASTWTMRMNGTSAEMIASSEKLDQLTEMLTGQESRLVIDKTGLTGKYDWDLKWTPEEAEMSAQGDDGSAAGSGAPGMFGALKEQLGLELEPSKGPVQIVVVDHVEPPTPN